MGAADLSLASPPEPLARLRSSVERRRRAPQLLTRWYSFCAAAITAARFAGALASSPTR